MPVGHNVALPIADPARSHSMLAPPVTSRDANSLATYAALRQMGRVSTADLVERRCAHTHKLDTGIGALPGVLWEPRFNGRTVRRFATEVSDR